MPAPSPSVVVNPSGYVTQHLIATADGNGDALAVSTANPLPVLMPGAVAASSATLAGSATASGLAGPFVPQLGRPMLLTLSGNWAGSVQLQRSVDGGATRSSVTLNGAPWAVFSGNCDEPVWEPTDAGAAYYLNITLASGSVGYRLAQ